MEILQVDHRIPVVLLSGFLGSGKTTLLKNIMVLEENMQDTVIIMNEFGEVGIDGMLMDEDGKKNMIELSSGCICCSLKEGLEETLDQVIVLHPKKVLIEATGVADPSAITRIAEIERFQKALRPAKIITVMDAECWDVREVFGTVFYNQLENADTILLNKVDLLTKDEIAKTLQEMHELLPDAQIIPTVQAKIEPEMIWELKEEKCACGHHHSHGEKECACTHDHGHDHTHDHGDGPCDCDHTTFVEILDGVKEKLEYITFSFVDTAPMEEECFRTFLKELPFEVYRTKGTVFVGDKTYLVNSVGGKIEWRDWDGVSETRLAMIGWNVDAHAILEKLKACVK